MKKFFIFTVCIWAVVFLFENCSKTKVTDDMYRFIPKYILSLVSFDFQKLRKIRDFPVIYSMWEKDINESGVGRQFHEFIKISGIEIKENLDKIIIFTGPYRIDKIPNMGMVIKLKFDNDKLARAINTFSSKEEQEIYLGITIKGVFFKDTKEKHNIAVPDSSHLLLAPKEILKNMIDVYKGNKKGVLTNKKIRPFIYSEKESQIAWFVWLFEDIIKEKKLETPPGFPPTGLESLSVFAGEKEGEAKVISRSEFEIKRFSQYLMNAKAAVSVMPPPDNDQEKLIYTLFKSASIKVTSSSIQMFFKNPRMMILANEIIFRSFFKALWTGNLNIRKLI
ncbi:MAG: hypothetical protein GTO45_08310 [Candidatus Aminicenantes bacterium]|nr:hypothetical protein [Candidatus Aminicenantes bacterium]NIM78833.1 hypothetical protein [Candidatus Aminicenantes bacterium]NIN18089.1 hypothetical protein [Candidatus Aminicenantes bacterium]NIN41988.1 hypothetical protein [Candidatus Aminicenantes bacterium]NIN84744.1 hypothetical protein [Candidatus Aminicenantes bacterium]